ncbi:MAG: sulfotransferase [Alphaproteobacteria bacterium]|nr:sulfotransferase [Alphaproteobacteria bacterium]
MSAKRPNFLIGGTSAGGTSFLSAMLVQHPQIYLPKEMRPEPHYFYKSWEYEKGDEYFLERWFSAVNDDHIAIGERSSSYMFGGKDTAEKIAKFNPEMKLIFTVRNPIERTWANYRYTALQGLEDHEFHDALLHEKARIAAQDGIWAEIQPHNYTGRGFYGRQIQDFLEFFPREQILLIKSETLSSDTHGELLKLYDFLGLTDKDFEPARAPDHTSVNVKVPAVQKELRDYFEARFDKIIEALRKNEDPAPFLSNEEDERNMERLRDNMAGEKMPMPAQSRAYLQDVFADDIALLQNMVDFDLSDWA